MGQPVATMYLRRSGSAVVDGTGAATVQLSPDGSGEYWLPTSAAVKCNTDTSEGVCRIYIGAKASDDTLVDVTGSGSFGDATGRVAGRTIGRHADPSIIAVWSGADVGSTVTLLVTGTKYLRG